MGSTSDLPVMEKAAQLLNDMHVPFEMNALSAHRTPEAVEEFAKNARNRGIKVIIAAAGMAAALPGVIAANTTLPVIGVPVKGSVLDGVKAGLDGHFDRRNIAGVHRHLASHAVTFVDRGVQLGLGQLLAAIRFAGQNLDPVGAVAQLAADGLADFPFAVALTHRARHRPAVTACHTDALTAGNDARNHSQPLLLSPSECLRNAPG